MVITATVFCQNVYVVTKTTDPNPFTDPYKFNDAECDPDMLGTLQWAINKSNDDNAESVIEFNIAGNGPHEITLNYYLPQIVGTTVIDGRTQSGYTFGNPQIIINAQNKQNSVFNAYKTNVTIKGLKITSFAQNGILLQDCHNSLVAENIIFNYSNSSTKTPFIGLFINGCQNVEVYGNEIEVLLNETVDQVTKSYGIYLSKSYQCTIGGTGTNMANTIKNCRTYGVFLNSTQETKISGNQIFDNGKAIMLNYSNNNIQPPIINGYTNGILSGTALPNSTVEVFGSTGSENANEYLVSSVTNGNGDWSVEVSTEFEYLAANQTDLSNNTSSFSVLSVKMQCFQVEPLLYPSESAEPVGEDFWVQDPNVHPDMRCCSGGDPCECDEGCFWITSSQGLSEINQETPEPSNINVQIQCSICIEDDTPLYIHEVTPLPYDEVQHEWYYTSNGIEIISSGHDEIISFTASEAGIGIHTITICGECDGNWDPTYACRTAIITVYGPDATITPVVPLCENDEAVTLQAVTPGGEWTIDGVVNTTGTFDPTIGPGIYTISYYVETDGCSDEDEITITVYESPDPTVSDIQACEGEDITFISEHTFTTANAVNYSWEGPNGNGPASNMWPIGNIQTSNEGEYTITVEYDYGDKICAETTSGYLSVLESPEVSFSEFTGLCPGDEISITAYGGTGYLWSNGSSNATTNIITGGTYSVSVSNDNCTTVAEINVPESNLIISDYQSSPACENNANGELIILTMGGVEPYSYNWSGPNAFGSTSSFLSNLEEGTYNVTVTDMIGCSIMEEFVIESLNNPIAEITGDSFACEGSIDLTATGGIYYNWNNGMYGETITVVETNTYFVTVTDENGCTSQDDFYVEIANEIEDLTVLYQDDDICSGIVQFIANTDGGVFQLVITNLSESVIYFSESLYISDNTIFPNNQLELFHNPGIYQVKLRSADTNCRYELEFIVPVDCPEIIAESTPGTCVYPYNGTVEVTISEGTPPYLVYLAQDFEVVSDVYEFLEPGTYIIETNENFSPNLSFNVIVDDNDPYYNEIQIAFQTAMHFPWHPDDVYTTATLTENFYENKIICIGVEGNQSLDITHDVTFENCTIYCATQQYDNILETLWKVKQENSLILNNSIVTTGCPHQLWSGIYTEGDCPDFGSAGFDPSLEPGQLHITNSTLMYANIAANGLYNAVVKIKHSKFINCPIGVDLYVYNDNAILTSSAPEIKPRAYVYKCQFETNEDFIEPPVSHINLFHSSNINFLGNSFSNTVPNDILSGASRGIGVTSKHSAFTVKEYCPLLQVQGLLCANATISTFTGLYYGIWATNLEANTAKIEHCQFNNYGTMGVYLQNVLTPRITSNTFNKEQGGILTKNVGLYLKSCTGYNIENNTFNNGTIGMVINNSGTYTNKVYRNHFNNPRSGFHSYYTNSNQDGSLGLFIQCNDYHNNNGTQNFIKDGNVKRQQGYYDSQYPQNSTSTANQFEIGNLTPSSESAFKTSYDYSFNYKYWCNNFGDGITDITGLTSSTVTVDEIGTNINIASTCPSRLSPFVIDYGHEISRRKSDIINLNDNMDDIVDGGNTAEVLQKVQNLKPNNFNKTCNELLNISPYLSDTVLVAFMQTGVNGHVIAKTNVLLASSPLPPNARAELETMDLPAPHKNYIEQMQTGTNAVIQLKDEIGNIEFDKNLIINDYISYGLNNDSIPQVKDSVVNFLMNDDYFESKCLVIPILIADGRYTDAQTQINELDYLASNQNLSLQTELSEFSELQEIIILADTTYTDEAYLTIVENNLSLLEAIAYNPSHRGSSLAQILLSEAGLAEFEPEIFLPMDNRSMRFSLIEESNTESFDLNDLIEVYPSPASSEIWVEYLMVNDKPVSKIEVYNIEGKLLLSQSIRNKFGLERIDVSQLSEGNYILKLGEFTKQIGVIK